MIQFEDEYQVGIKYSCEYTPKEDGEVSIECIFKEYSPMLRLELETEFTDALSEKEASVILPVSGPLQWRLELLVEDVYEVGKDPLEVDRRLRLGLGSPLESTVKYPVILGFKTIIFTKPQDSIEIVQKKVKEWTKDVAALILHSPLFDTEMIKRPDLPSIPRVGYREFSKTKPKRFTKMDQYWKHPEWYIENQNEEENG